MNVSTYTIFVKANESWLFPDLVSGIEKVWLNSWHATFEIFWDILHFKFRPLVIITLIFRSLIWCQRWIHPIFLSFVGGLPEVLSYVYSITTLWNSSIFCLKYHSSVFVHIHLIVLVNTLREMTDSFAQVVYYFCNYAVCFCTSDFLSIDENCLLCFIDEQMENSLLCFIGLLHHFAKLRKDGCLYRAK